MFSMSVTTEVDHRGGMALVAEHLHPPVDILQRVGGPDAIAKIIDGLYDRIEADQVLRPMFGKRLEAEAGLADR